MTPSQSPQTPAVSAAGKAPASFLLWLSLTLVFLGGLGAHLVRSDWDRVDLVGLKIPTENGQWITADLFRPRAASEKNPVPLVIVCPGFERSKETMDAYAIELVRRGIAVITIDPYNQGASSTTYARRSTTTEGNGVGPMLEYVWGTPNLNYIDKARIGAVGYSAGGNAVLQTASRLGAKRAKLLGQFQQEGSEAGKALSEGERSQLAAQDKLAGVFVGGFVLTFTDEVIAPLSTNVGVDYASHDEGAFRNQEKHARMEEASESLRMVNSVLGAAKVSRVELGHAYGDPARRTLRVIHNTPNLHPLMPSDPRHIARVLEFFMTIFRLTPALPAGSQVWFFKELLTALALVGGLLFVVPFTRVLLRLPFFAVLVREVPPARAAPMGWRRFRYWALFAFSALVACFLFVPMARLSNVLFTDASNRIPTWFFPQRINNAILLWAVANGLLGLAVFFIGTWLRRLKGEAVSMTALQVGAGGLLRTLLLALSVFAAYYALVLVSYGLFHTDLRAVFISAPAHFPVKMLLVALQYLPLFLIFYLANSIRVNCASRFEGQPAWLNKLVNGLGNSVGLLLILVIQYSGLLLNGTVFWTDEWLYVNLLLGIIPMMFLLPYYNRSFFLMTGRVYLGPLVSCLIFIMMMLTSNVCYIPID